MINSKLKFVIKENVELTEEELQIINSAYRNLFKEIYGYDILGQYLEEKDKLKNAIVYRDAYINAIDIIKSLEINDMNLLLIYNENDLLIGAGRIRVSEKTNINKFFNLINRYTQKENNYNSIPDIAVLKEFDEDGVVFKEAIRFLEDYYASLGFEEIFVELPFSSSFVDVATNMGYVEDIRYITDINRHRTRFLNKDLERTKDEEFNISRK